MKTVYLPSFIKDLKALKNTPTYISIRQIAFEQIPEAPSFQDIRNLKKLKSSQNSYRIRVGDYRIGITYSGFHLGRGQIGW